MKNLCNFFSQWISFCCCWVFFFFFVLFLLQIWWAYWIQKIPGKLLVTYFFSKTRDNNTLLQHEFLSTDEDAIRRSILLRLRLITFPASQFVIPKAKLNSCFPAVRVRCHFDLLGISVIGLYSIWDMLVSISVTNYPLTLLVSSAITSDENYGH